MSLALLKGWVQLSQLVSESARWLDREDDGGDAVEYALIIGLVAFAIIVGLTTLGGKLNAVFSGMAGKLVTG